MEIMKGKEKKARKGGGEGEGGDAEDSRAVIGMREGKRAVAIEDLRKAVDKKECLREVAKADVEFARLLDTPEFQAL